ncbi:hypothetical protein DFH06DRAFT_595166 [Mycena polygramma]|nr:hypothetical protein DFH06DRAFT_595166 [Mycena polygramma]
MKISNPSSSPADVRVVVTYTVEPGDPKAFFFEVVDNGRRMDIANKQAFSVSGSFFTIPGDVGSHFIEAYNSTDVVGINQPFAVGPVYTVLPPLPGSAPAPTVTVPVPVPSTSTIPPAKSTVTTRTQTTSNLPQNVQTPAPETPLASSSPLLNVISIGNPTATPSASLATTTFFDSVDGSIITVQQSISAAASAPSSSFSASAVSPSGNVGTINLRAIIGAIVAGAIVLAIIIFFVVRRRTRRNRTSSRESLTMNSSPTIDPFLLFASRPNEKHLRGFVRMQDSASSSSTTSDKGSSTWRDSASREDSAHAATVSSRLPAVVQQMEWVLRPTSDPPPGYNSPDA